MRRFELHREVDESGISGTGVVAEGVAFSDGTAALRWKSEFKSTAVYQTMADVEAIHGHNGQTKVVWFDASPEDRRETVKRLLERALACPPAEGTDCAFAAIHALSHPSERPA
jgi:hypothetical protein